MKSPIITKGFILAGLSNIFGVLILSKLFTNQVIMDVQPDVMGYFGHFVYYTLESCLYHGKKKICFRALAYRCICNRKNIICNCLFKLD